jgi:hypothetical protein
MAVRKRGPVHKGEQTLDDHERKLLIALARMVDQYLTDGELLDNRAMRAGETALAVLAEHGLVTIVGGYRFGRWTNAGRELLNSN